MIWEKVQYNQNHSISRAKIFGGWLVRIQDAVSSNGVKGEGISDLIFKEVRTSLTFVPDPGHEWDFNTEY